MMNIEGEILIELFMVHMLQQRGDNLVPMRVPLTLHIITI